MTIAQTTKSRTVVLLAASLVLTAGLTTGAAHACEVYQPDPGSGQTGGTNCVEDPPSTGDPTNLLDSATVPVIVPPRPSVSGTTGLIRQSLVIDVGSVPSAEIGDFVASSMLAAADTTEAQQAQGCGDQWGARALNQTAYVRGSYIRHDGATWQRTRGCVPYTINLHASMSVEVDDGFRDVRWPRQSGTCAGRDTRNQTAQTCDSPNLSAKNGDVWIAGFGGAYKPDGFSNWNISGEIDIQVVT